MSIFQLCYNNIVIRNIIKYDFICQIRVEFLFKRVSAPTVICAFTCRDH